MAGIEDETLTAEPSDEDMKPESPSSSSSDDASDDEAAEDLQIQTLESSLAENPVNYDAHLAYIQCLRKSGQIEKLRHARELMNGRFPLSPKMWQEWINDEISLGISSEAVTKIEKLFELGIQEYLSVSLWCDYINFLQEHDQAIAQCTDVGISKMRKVFENAIIAAGLHAMEGNKIWEAYRTFEEALTLTKDETNLEEKVKQLNRVRALYHRQLSVPLVDMKSTLRDYKIWEVQQGNISDMDSEFDGVPAHVVSAYRKALDLYNAREQYETLVSNTESTEAERLKQFLLYIKFEESSRDPVRVQILYERAISEFPISSELWLSYTSYLDRTLKVPSVLKSVYSRATRNCTWVVELWVRRLLSLERINALEKELSEVFEQSIQCTFSSFKEYLELFLTRVDGLRRRISLSGNQEDGLNYSLIRDTFQRAVECLPPEFLSSEDLVHFYTYWARLEASLGKDLIAARGVWESLVKKSGTVLEIWQAYIAMEIELGGPQSEARSIYRRCYTKRFPGTGSEDICHSWLRFEREFGTLNDYDLAAEKVAPRLLELQRFKSQQDSQTELVTGKKESSFPTSAPPKRKINNLLEDKQPPKKKKKHSALGAVGSSESYKVEVKDDVQNAGVDTSDTNQPAKVAESDENTKQQMENIKLKEPIPKRYKDECTAFISNIGLEAKEEDLRLFFSDCGGVIAIRLLKDKYTGKSRGLAYVDFSDEEHLATAISKNKQKLHGHKLSIARSNPKQSHGSSTGQRKPSGIAHNRGGRTKMDLSAKNVANKHERKEKITTNVTFAAPRAVTRPLGGNIKESHSEQDSEKPKSNDEFREMFLKK